MRKSWLYLLFSFSCIRVAAQSLPAEHVDRIESEIAFVSDTQAPMLIEKLFLKTNHNTQSTKLIFDDIVQRSPRCLFILGDVVSLGHVEKKWKAMDQYLAAARRNHISIFALLGNHDVMGGAKKGERNFNRRFPDHIKTGFSVVIDSMAVVMLNSNFRKLSANDKLKQQAYYTETLGNLDGNPSINLIVVACHHAPYSNSTIVGSSQAVEKEFVPLFVKSKKAKLFITGHAHGYEHFQLQGKDFLTIGGGGGLHHTLKQGNSSLHSQAEGYNPEFHYLTLRRVRNTLVVTSYRLEEDFSHFKKGDQFSLNLTK